MSDERGDLFRSISVLAGSRQCHVDRVDLIVCRIVVSYLNVSDGSLHQISFLNSPVSVSYTLNTYEPVL